MSGSVTRLLPAIRSGDFRAQAELWERFRRSLQTVAKKNLNAAALRLVDAEDVMTDAVCSVLQRLRNGQYIDLQNRNDLWKLLSTVTVRRAISCNRFANRAKRHSPPQCDGGHDILDTLPAIDQGFAEAAEMEDLVRHLLATLPDDELRQICMMRLSGFTADEIAEEIGRSTPTVDRRLRVLRAVWSDAIARMQ